MVTPFIVAGVGMTLFFVPLASLVLGSVPTALEGVASGTNSAFRELGGVLGIAVLGAVFSSSGGYHSSQAFVNGFTPAIEVGAAAVFLGHADGVGYPRGPAGPGRPVGCRGRGSGGRECRGAGRGAARGAVSRPLACRGALPSEPVSA